MKKNLECKGMKTFEKVLLFYNPYAGNGIVKTSLDTIVERFQEAGKLIVPIRIGDSELLDFVLKSIDPGDFRQIIAAGGDGTVNLCVNAMIRNNIDLPLSIFPVGTANDFAYYLELPSSIDRMIDIALGDCYTYADVGKVNDRYFINVSAIGMIVDVSQKTDPNLKSTLGVLSYYIRGLQEVPNIRPIPIKVRSQEFSEDLKIYFMLIMNGKSAGGFKKISPYSEINDGLLDVLIFKEMPIIEFGPLLVKILQGQHQDNKHVISFKTRELFLESKVKVGTDIDGEKGDNLPLQFQVISKKLKIFTLYDHMEGAKW